MLDKVFALLDGREPGVYGIAVNPRSRSKLAGNKKSNLNTLREQGYKITIVEDDSLTSGKIKLLPLAHIK